MVRELLPRCEFQRDKLDEKIEEDQVKLEKLEAELETLPAKAHHGELTRPAAVTKAIRKMREILRVKKTMQQSTNKRNALDGIIQSIGSHANDQEFDQTVELAANIAGRALATRKNPEEAAEKWFGQLDRLNEVNAGADAEIGRIATASEQGLETLPDEDSAIRASIEALFLRYEQQEAESSLLHAGLPQVPRGYRHQTSTGAGAAAAASANEDPVDPAEARRDPLE
jgi:chromosome segregation ATPase